jgi:hypothetical protein
MIHHLSHELENLMYFNKEFMLLLISIAATKGESKQNYDELSDGAGSIRKCLIWT